MIRRIAPFLATLALVFAGFVSLAQADIPPGPPPSPTPVPTDDGDSVANERAAGFEAVEGTGTENVSGLGMMVGAYGLVWTFIMLYLVRVGRIEADVAASIDRLESKLGPD